MTSDRFQRQKFVPALMLAGLLGFAPVLPAMADDTDPLQVETGHWMSLDRYTDNIKKNRPLGNEVIENKPKIETPSLEAPAPDQAQKTAVISPATVSPAPNDDSQPVVAAPTRPLDLPLLPGINKGFGLAINSTADQPTAPAQIVQDDKGKTDMEVPEHNWQDAAESARQFKAGNTSALNDAEHNSIDIRYSFLPNSHVVPVFERAYKPRTRVADVPVAPKPVAAEEAQKTAGPAECAAIDAYKKKQLEAIQSDRQTLQALQAAIVDLGLQKQLDFMTGAKQSPSLSSVSAPNPFASTSVPATATP